MDGSLYLHDCTTALSGNLGWKLKLGFAPLSPTAMLRQSLARFVPALHKVMVNVDHRGARQFYVNVVIVPFTGMTWHDHGMGIEIDPPDKGRFIFGAGINEPAFLMLAK